MDNRSVSEIKKDIDIRMKKLGKLIIIRRLACTLSLTSLFISMYNFVMILWKVTNESNTLHPAMLCIVFMAISLIFIILYSIIVNISTEIKRNIYNDKRILKKLS